MYMMGTKEFPLPLNIIQKYYIHIEQKPSIQLYLYYWKIA